MDIVHNLGHHRFAEVGPSHHCLRNDTVERATGGVNVSDAKAERRAPDVERRRAMLPQQLTVDSEWQWYTILAVMATTLIFTYGMLIWTIAR
jgi:hypothetical protein